MHLKTVTVFMVATALSGCVTKPAVTANLMVAKSAEQVKKCIYVSSFKMNFATDGVPMNQASKKEQYDSNMGFRDAVAAGANTIYRVEPAPAPLVKVNAYRCQISDLATPAPI